MGLDRAKANIEYLSKNNIKVTQRIVELQSAMSVFIQPTEDYEYRKNIMKKNK